jgi:hypothetical protein
MRKYFDRSTVLPLLIQAEVKHNCDMTRSLHLQIDDGVIEVQGELRRK